MLLGMDAVGALAPDDREQVEAIVSIAREVLGEAEHGGKLLGLYVLGSATIGGLRPTSDLDVLGVLDAPTSVADRRSLVTRLPSISGSPEPRGRWRPVELTLVVRDDVVPWRYPPMRELQYGEWDRERYLGGFVPKPEPDPDLAILMTEVLLANAPLLGPEPAAILAPVPLADLRRAMVAEVPGMLTDLEHDTRNYLLTLARVWATLETGEILPKDAAAAWASERLAAPLASEVELARRQYLDGSHGGREWPSRMRSARAAAEAMAAHIDRLEPPSA